MLNLIQKTNRTILSCGLWAIYFFSPSSHRGVNFKVAPWNFLDANYSRVIG